VSLADVVTEEKYDDPLAQARQFLEDGMLEECMTKLKPYWLGKPDDPSAMRMFGSLMAESGRSELARKLKTAADLADSGASTEESRQGYQYAIFEAAFSLIDVREFELAIMLLHKCLESSPNDPTVHYEMAFALMSLNQFEEALKHFKVSASDKEDFDTVLNLMVCYTLTRKLPEAKEMLEKLSTVVQNDEEERQELAHRKAVLKRLEGMSKKSQLTPRDWLYVLYGGVLLQDGDQETTVDDYTAMASMLLIAKGVLEGLRVEYESVEYYNLAARPLARALAELMEVTCTSYMGPDRPDRTLLLLAWAPEIIGPHNVFIEHTETRSLFAYSIDWDEPLPVTPEICGRLAGQAPISWLETMKEADEEKHFKAVIDRARTLESDPDILQKIQDAVLYYQDKKELMVLNNAQLFPQRPEYTAEILHS
jgi:tetratricopeptide (TPR) repeat protein